MAPPTYSATPPKRRLEIPSTEIQKYVPYRTDVVSRVTTLGSGAYLQSPGRGAPSLYVSGAAELAWELRATGRGIRNVSEATLQAAGMAYKELLREEWELSKSYDDNTEATRTWKAQMAGRGFSNEHLVHSGRLENAVNNFNPSNVHWRSNVELEIDMIGETGEFPRYVEAIEKGTETHFWGPEGRSPTQNVAEHNFISRANIRIFPHILGNIDTGIEVIKVGMAKRAARFNANEMNNLRALGITTKEAGKFWERKRAGEFFPDLPSMSGSYYMEFGDLGNYDRFIEDGHKGAAWTYLDKHVGAGLTGVSSSRLQELGGSEFSSWVRKKWGSGTWINLNIRR